MMAAMFGHDAVVGLLLERGAEVDKANKVRMNCAQTTSSLRAHVVCAHIGALAHYLVVIWYSTFSMNCKYKPQKYPMKCTYHFIGCSLVFHLV